MVDSACGRPCGPAFSAQASKFQLQGAFSETVLFWLWGALADLAGGHRVGAEIAPYASASAFGLMGEAAVRAVSLADAFEYVVARYVRVVHQGITIEIYVNGRFFTTVYRLSGSAGTVSSGVDGRRECSGPTRTSRWCPSTRSMCGCVRCRPNSPARQLAIWEASSPKYSGPT